MRIWTISTLIAVMAAALGGGCVVSEVDQTTGPCDVNEDCPSGYSCVTSPRFTGKSCQQPFETFEPTPSDLKAFYCTEVKPILDTYCISCHKNPPAGGADASFRLDVYSVSPAGAKEKAERIVARVKQKTMPPGGNGPDANQTALLEGWLNTGAPECATAP
jgi:hypothetical protein